MSMKAGRMRGRVRALVARPCHRCSIRPPARGAHSHGEAHVTSNARGMVQYTATFFLTKPIDMSKSSGMLFQEVPNRVLARPPCRAARFPV